MQDIIEKHLGTIYGEEKLKDQIMLMARRTAFVKMRGSTPDVSQMHMIFAGNPGTGKTMAARCMAGLWNNLSILQ